ncbi:MAG: nitrite reductase (NAD(P)H) small subunit [Deltaproteobacteria bacterium]|nr:nitrite reductase (NAD(P)H) small subunit [Deltaproteobacteria bacterium]
MTPPHEPVWERAFPLLDLPVGGARLVRAHGQQVAVFRPEEDAVFAVDNRCPHEGYPLSEGQVHGPLLVCAWHGFVFDLRNGRCMGGDENVRSYPTRLVDGAVEVDLSEPDAAATIPPMYESLHEGLLENRSGQVTRDLLRLLRAGVPAERLALEAAIFDAERAEFGTGHALPVAADVAEMLHRHPGNAALGPLMQAMEAASVPNIRRPMRPPPDPVDPGPDPVLAGERLCAAVEKMQVGEAEALLRGALQRGFGRDVIEPWFYRVCTAHFLGFGHGLIYTVKVFDLLDRAGWEHAERLLPALLFRLGVLTREELIPTERRLRDALAAIEPRQDALFELCSHTSGVSESSDGESGDETAELIAAVLDGSDAQALAAVSAALEKGTGLRVVAQALAVAAAERLVRFDERLDCDPTVQDGWLDVVHLFTFANAVRHAVERHPRPDVLRLLLFAARFVQRGRTLDLDPDSRGLSVLAADGPAVDLDEVMRAVRGRDAQGALVLARGFLVAGGDRGELRDALEDVVLRDQATRAIFAAHHVKLLAAAWDESSALERRGGSAEDDAIRPLLAAVHFLASPLGERGLERLRNEAIRFVEGGKPPRRLMV